MDKKKNDYKYDVRVKGNKYTHRVLCTNCCEALEKIGYPMPSSKDVTRGDCNLCDALGINTGEVAQKLKKGTMETAIFLAEHEQRLFQRLLNEANMDLQRYKAELAKYSK